MQLGKLHELQKGCKKPARNPNITRTIQESNRNATGILQEHDREQRLCASPPQRLLSLGRTQTQTTNTFHFCLLFLSAKKLLSAVSSTSSQSSSALSQMHLKVPNVFAYMHNGITVCITMLPSICLLVCIHFHIRRYLRYMMYLGSTLLYHECMCCHVTE